MNAPKTNSAPQYPPLSGSHLALLTLALPMATFMQVVDATIANVAIPTIAGNLGASYSQGTWVITSYSVANAIVLPLTGRLAQRFGEVKLFLWSTALFSICSLLCGLSLNLNMLVFFRIIQGAAGGPMMPLAQSLLMNNYPKTKQIMALAFWSMTVSIAPVFGPILGGVISDNYHWSWIFFINVPIGILVIIMTTALLSKRETHLSRPRWSVISFGLLAIGVGALQMMLDRGKELDWFNSPFITIMAVMATVGIVLLLVWEKSNPNPLIDLSLFKSRNYSIGVTLISLGMMVYLGTVVLLPLLLQTNFGYSATWAGIASAPVGIIPIFLTPIIGRYSHKIDLRILISFGFVVFAFCMQLRTNFSLNADLKFILIPQTIQGLALACFFVPITSITFIGLNPAKMAGASGLFNCVRTLFGAIGASAVTTLWEKRENIHHQHLSSLIDLFNPMTVETINTLENVGFSQEQTMAYINRNITNQSFVISANELYQLSTVIFLLMTGLIWFAKRQRMPSS